MRGLGIGPGPHVGRVLEKLLDQVLEQPELNDRTTLLRMISREFDEEKTGGRE
jgi:hypothetical protein